MSSFIVNTPLKLANRQFRIHVVLLPAAIAMMYLFTQLGYWQISRADEKTSLLQQSAQQMQQPAIELNQSADLKQPDYQPLKVMGSWLEKRKVYVANEQSGGRDGYHLYIPIELAEHQSLLWVNLGWLQALPDRRFLPDAPPIPEQLELTGYAYYSKGEPILFEKALQQFDTDTWLLQGRDNQLLFSTFSERKNSTIPFIMRATGGGPEGLNTDFIIVAVNPDKHLAYAIQWFGLCGLTGVLALVLSFRKVT